MARLQLLLWMSPTGTAEVVFQEPLLLLKDPQAVVDRLDGLQQLLRDRGEGGQVGRRAQSLLAAEEDLADRLEVIHWYVCRGPW